MCIVSNIGDGYQGTFSERWPTIPIPTVNPVDPMLGISWVSPDLSKFVTIDQFNALKKEIEQLKPLILEAQKFDAATGQANCDSPLKFALVKWLAKALDVDLSELKLAG